MKSNEDIKLSASFTLRNVKIPNGNIMLTNGNIALDGEVESNKGVEIKLYTMDFNFIMFENGFEDINS